MPEKNNSSYLSLICRLFDMLTFFEASSSLEWLISTTSGTGDTLSNKAVIYRQILQLI